MWSRGDLYYSKKSWIAFIFGLGQGTNNYAKLSSLRLLLCLAKECDIKELHIFGDSQVIIYWI